MGLCRGETQEQRDWFVLVGFLANIPLNKCLGIADSPVWLESDSLVYYSNLLVAWDLSCAY